MAIFFTSDFIVLFFVFICTGARHTDRVSQHFLSICPSAWAGLASLMLFLKSSTGIDIMSGQIQPLENRTVVNMKI